MKGANTSTVVATMSNNPVTHKKIASGVIQRLSESLCHNPCVNCAIDPNVLPNTINPRRVLLRVFITQPPSPLFFLVVSLPAPRCASPLESLRQPEHLSCSAEMLSTLQRHD